MKEKLPISFDRQCNSRENGNPEYIKLNGFPLLPTAGRFVGMTNLFS